MEVLGPKYYTHSCCWSLHTITFGYLDPLGHIGSMMGYGIQEIPQMRGTQYGIKIIKIPHVRIPKQDPRPPCMETPIWPQCYGSFGPTTSNLKVYFHAPTLGSLRGLDALFWGGDAPMIPEPRHPLAQRPHSLELLSSKDLK